MIKRRSVWYLTWDSTYKTWDLPVSAVLFIVFAAVICSVILVFVPLGSVHYWYSSWHNVWASNLLYSSIGLTYSIGLLYALVQWKVLPSWLPFQKSGLIWNRLPYFVWLVLSFIWVLVFLVVFLIYCSLAFELWLNMLHCLCISLWYRDGTAELKMNKVWIGKEHMSRFKDEKSNIKRDDEDD